MSATSLRTPSRDRRDRLSRGELDRFVQLQARPAEVDIQLEGDGRPPSPVPTAPDERCVSIPGGTAQRHSVRSYPPQPGQVPARSSHPVDPMDLLDLVACTAVQRLEPRSAVNPHRAYPAAHCFFAATVHLVSGGLAWAFDPVGHRLVPVGRHGESPDTVAVDATAEFVSTVRDAGGALVIVSGQLDGVPERYHELRWSLVLTECGHLSELLVHGARVLGWQVRQQDDFADEDVLDALGLTADSGVVPTTVLELGTASTPDHVEDMRRRPAAATSQHLLSPSTRQLLRVDQAGWQQATLAAPRDRSTSRGGPHTRSAPWGQVLFERSAARVNKGLTARPGPLAADAIQDTLSSLVDALGDQPPVAEGGIAATLAVSRVDGLRPGLHRVTGQGCTWSDARDGIALLQEVFNYPTVQMSVTSCPAAIILTGDYRACVAHGGARRLRTSQLDLGRALQAAGLALTLHDAFLRPARSFDTDRLAQRLDLPTGTLPLYVGLIGQSRFTDLLMDVRP